MSADTVGRLLKQAGYSLQATRKTRETTDHPDRDQCWAPGWLRMVGGLDVTGGERGLGVGVA